MFDVQISVEGVIKSVMAWSALNRTCGNNRNVLGITDVRGLEVIVRDEAEMLSGGLFPWIRGFDEESLTYRLAGVDGVSNTDMLRLAVLFERAVTYGVLMCVCDCVGKDWDTLKGLRSDAMGAIRTALRANVSTDITPRRW